MKTVSVNVMNLCVPCENRCRYCLLSYDGHIHGVDFERSVAYARQFYEWIRENRPDLSFLFGFGYSMEHPDLIRAIRFCQSIGSATGEFLQFDGMKFRTESELRQLLSELKTNGIKLIDLTFYGTEEYHDRFAARTGDFRLMMDTLYVANQIGLEVSVSIPVTGENFRQLDALMDQIQEYRTVRTVCFVPHSEGRGRLLDAVRFSVDNYEQLSDRVKRIFNRERFRPEREWVQSIPMPVMQKRVLTVTLTPDNIGTFEKMDFSDTISYLEQLDDTYFQTIPDFDSLLKLYGNAEGTKMYSARDLYMHYQRRYIAEHGIEIYDINDERQCFVRRI